MISYSGGPQNLNLNWCKNYELQNTLIRCEKVDFPYISMESAVFTKTTTIFNTKQLFFVQLNQDRILSHVQSTTNVVVLGTASAEQAP